MTKTEALMLMESALGYSREDCLNILTVMEEAVGMLPPYRPSDGKVIRCQISEWEPDEL